MMNRMDATMTHTTHDGTSLVTGTLMKPTLIDSNTKKVEKKMEKEKEKKRSNCKYILLLSVLICMIILVIIAFVTILIVKKTNVYKSSSSISSSSSSSSTNTSSNSDMSKKGTITSSTSSITDTETDSDTDTDTDIDIDIVPSSPSSTSTPPIRPVSVKTNNTTTKTNININTTNIGNASDTSTDSDMIPPTATVPSRSPISTSSMSPSPSTLTSSEPSTTNNSSYDDEHVPNEEELYSQLFNIGSMKVPKQFRIKMHWERQYLWQDEVIERQWCIECTTCPYLNFDLTNTECDIVVNHQCTIGNQIWIVPCEYNYGTIFTIKPLLLPLIPITLRSRRHKNYTRNSSDDPDGNNDEHDDYNDYYYHQIQIVQNETTKFNVDVYNKQNYVTDAGNFTATVSIHYNDSNRNKTTHQEPILLCLERTETRYVTLQQCQEYDMNVTYYPENKSNNSNHYYYTPQQLAQLWDPLVPNHNNDSRVWNSNNTNTNTNIANDGMMINTTTYVTFTLTPAIILDNDIIHNQTSWCLTDQHHPKSEEIVALKPCTISDKWNTGYWNIFPIP